MKQYTVVEYEQSDFDEIKNGMTKEEAAAINQSRPDYKYYGGRGITVCDEWKNSFHDFKSWAMASG